MFVIHPARARSAERQPEREGGQTPMPEQIDLSSPGYQARPWGSHLDLILLQGDVFGLASSRLVTRSWQQASIRQLAAG